MVWGRGEEEKGVGGWVGVSEWGERGEGWVGVSEWGERGRGEGEWEGGGGRSGGGRGSGRE